MEESEQKKYYGKSLFQWLIPTRQFVKWSVAIVPLLFVIAFATLQYWAHNHFKLLLENEIDFPLMKELLNKTVAFPEMNLDNVRLSKELKKAYSNLSDIPNATHNMNTAFRSFKNKRNLEERKEIFDGFQSTIQIGIDVTKQIERDIQNLHPGEPLPINSRYVEYYRCRLINLLEHRGRYFADVKQYDDALLDYQHAILLTLQCPFQDIQSYLDSLFSIQGISNTMRYCCCPHASSKETLKSVLDTLNDIEPLVFQDLSDRVETLTNYSILNTFKLRHPEFDASPGKKWEDYVDRMAYLTFPEFHDTKPFDLDVRYLNGMEIREIEIAVLLKPVAISNSVNDFIRYYYCLNSPLYNPPTKATVNQQQIEAAATFDQLRLTIAARLFELETGKTVEKTTDLVPAYFPNEIVDRETGNSYQWDANEGLFATP